MEAHAATAATENAERMLRVRKGRRWKNDVKREDSVEDD